MIKQIGAGSKVLTHNEFESFFDENNQPLEEIICHKGKLKIPGGIKIEDLMDCQEDVYIDFIKVLFPYSQRPS